MFEQNRQNDETTAGDGSTGVSRQGESVRRRRTVLRPVAPSIRAAWERFAREQGHELRRCVTRAMRRVGWRPDPTDVDELVQETYCRVLGNTVPADVSSWLPAVLWAYLNRIAHSVVVDELRTRRAVKRGGGLAGEATRATMPHAREERPASAPSPEDRLIARERGAAMRHRVRELGGPEHGPRNLRILELSAIEGYTAREISHRLGGALTPSSVHTVLSRLRRELAAAG
jgi:RNA polymerase sigma factor (sigma-70 family)